MCTSSAWIYLPRDCTTLPASTPTAPGAVSTANQAICTVISKATVAATVILLAPKQGCIIAVQPTDINYIITFAQKLITAGQLYLVTDFNNANTWAPLAQFSLITSVITSPVSTSTQL